MAGFLAPLLGDLVLSLGAAACWGLPGESRLALWGWGQ